MYEHLRLRRFRVHHHRPGRAQALSAHPDLERRVQGLLHDRLAHRLCRRPDRADQGDGGAAVAIDHQPQLDQPGRRRSRRSNGPQDFIPRNNAVVQGAARSGGGRCSTAARACIARRREGAFYVYPSCAGTIGKRTPDGKVIETDTDFVDISARCRGRGGGAGHGLRPERRISASPTPPRTPSCAKPAPASSAPAPSWSRLSIRSDQLGASFDYAALRSG